MPLLIKYFTAFILANLLVLGSMSAQDITDKKSKKYKSYLIIEGSMITPPSDFGLGLGLVRSNINDTADKPLHEQYQYVSIGIRSSYLIGIRAGIGKSGKDIGYRLSLAYDYSIPPNYTEFRIIPAATLDLSGKAILSIGPTLNIVHNTSRQLLGFELGIQLVPGRWSK